jgi:hypothetical protein
MNPDIQGTTEQVNELKTFKDKDLEMSRKTFVIQQVNLT